MLANTSKIKIIDKNSSQDHQIKFKTDKQILALKKLCI